MRRSTRPEQRRHALRPIAAHARATAALALTVSLVAVVIPTSPIALAAATDLGSATARTTATPRTASTAGGRAAWFVDVPSGHPFAPPIRWMFLEEIAQPDLDGKFRPAAELTRQAMAVWLWRVVNGGDADPTACTSPPYPDVPSTSPFCGHITELAADGLVGPYADGRFHPTDSISRQALAQWLWRLEHPSEPAAGACGTAPQWASSAFPDVPATNRFCTAITWLAGAGITNGYADGGFHPTDAITRQAAAAWLWRNEPTVPCDAAVGRASLTARGTEATGVSSAPSISADGQLVAFSSDAADLVEGDTNGWEDVFVKDCSTGRVERVSVADDGSQTTRPSGTPAISSNGRFVIFDTDASLDPADTDLLDDVYLRDRESGTTSLVSGGASDTSWQPCSGGGVDPAGAAVAFTCWAMQPWLGNGFVFDTASSTTTAIGHGWVTSISDDSDTIGYSYYWQDPGPMIPPPPTRGARLYHRGADAIETITGEETLDVSGDGRFVLVRDVGADFTSSVRVLDRVGAEGYTAASGGGSFGVGARLSPDGRAVAFVSHASNLVTGDTNGVADLFVFDSVTATLRRLPGGAGQFAYPVFSLDLADGGTTAFATVGSDLDTGDTNGLTDIYRFVGFPAPQPLAIVGPPDPVGLELGAPADIAFTSTGGLPPFTWTAAPLPDGLMIDTATGAVSGTPTIPGATLVTVTLTDGAATVATLDVTIDVLGAPACDTFDRLGSGSLAGASADGRVTAIITADALLPSDTNGVNDVYVADCFTGTIERLSNAPSGGVTDSQVKSATISGDGRHVAFFVGRIEFWVSELYALGQVFVVDRVTDTVDGVAPCAAEPFTGVFDLDLSTDGRYLAMATQGTPVAPSIWTTPSTEGAVVLDRQNTTCSWASVNGVGAVVDDPTIDVEVSDDGAVVAFTSSSPDLVAGDTNGFEDLFVHDFGASTTTLVTSGVGGAPADARTINSTLSADGTTIAFVSDATNLVASDTNGIADAFAYDVATAVVERVSVRSTGEQGTVTTLTGTWTWPAPALSADGNLVLFSSEATDLVTGDTNSAHDIFLHDRTTGTTRRVSTDAAGAEGAFHSFGTMSADGAYVHFSTGSALIPGDPAGATVRNIYRRALSLP